MFKLKITYCLLFLCCSLGSSAQVVDYIDIQLKVLEKVGSNSKALSNAKLNITDQGEVTTDADGKHQFSYAVRNEVDPKISISLVSDEYKTLKPLDASINLDPSKKEVLIEFLVVNMGEESEAFKKRINDLESRVQKLRAKNIYTERQLDAINTQLLDTILYFEQIRQELQSEITSYENLTEQQQQEIEGQKKKIEALEEQVNSLTQDLAAALEEQYLRQKEYFDNISSNLFSYLRKAKDIKDHLPFISSYFSSPGGYENYRKDINVYNKIFEEIDNKKLGYIEGIERYWESEQAVKRMESVFEFLLNGIHLGQMLPIANGIREEFVKQRPKKAQNVADESYEALDVNIRMLEKEINRALAQLRNSL